MVPPFPALKASHDAWAGAASSVVAGGGEVAGSPLFGFSLLDPSASPSALVSDGRPLFPEIPTSGTFRPQGFSTLSTVCFAHHPAGLFHPAALLGFPRRHRPHPTSRSTWNGASPSFLSKVFPPPATAVLAHDLLRRFLGAKDLLRGPTLLLRARVSITEGSDSLGFVTKGESPAFLRFLDRPWRCRLLRSKARQPTALSSRVESTPRASAEGPPAGPRFPQFAARKSRTHPEPSADPGKEPTIDPPRIPGPSTERFTPEAISFQTPRPGFAATAGVRSPSPTVHSDDGRATTRRD